MNLIIWSFDETIFVQNLRSAVLILIHLIKDYREMHLWWQFFVESNFFFGLSLGGSATTAGILERNLTLRPH